MRLEQYAVLCIKNNVNKEELWDAFQEVGKKHGLSLTTDLPVYVDDEDVHFDKSMTVEYRLSLIKEKIFEIQIQTLHRNDRLGGRILTRHMV